VDLVKMATQREIDKARNDWLDEKISFAEYCNIRDGLQSPRSSGARGLYESDTYSYRPRAEYGATSAPVSQDTLAAVQTSKPAFGHSFHRDSKPRKAVIYVSPTNYDGSILAKEQPNYQNGHVRSVWELHQETEYCVMKSDEKGTRQIGNVIIKGKPKEKPFRVKFYPLEGGAYEKNIDPVQYGLLPNGRGLWNASFWLATI